MKDWVFPALMQLCTDLQHPGIRLFGDNDFFQARNGPTRVVLTSLPWIQQPGQWGTGPSHWTSWEASLPVPTKTQLPLLRVFPSHRHPSFCPRGPRNPNPARFPGQAVHATNSGFPSVPDPPHLGLGTSHRGWIQRKRELLPLRFSWVPPGPLPKEIREAALITKQHSGRKTVSSHRSRRWARPGAKAYRAPLRVSRKTLGWPLRAADTGLALA